MKISKSKRIITAGTSLSGDMNTIYTKLSKALGSKADIQPSIYVALGDGSYAFITEDERTGDGYYINILNQSADEILDTEDEVVKLITDTWSEGDSIETAQDIDKTSDLPKDSITADEAGLEDYATEMGLKVVDKLTADGMEATVDVVEDYMEITITGGDNEAYNGYNYIQYLDEIVPDYEDIEEDAQQVYDTIKEELADMSHEDVEDSSEEGE